jgi:hypothetical protein
MPAELAHLEHSADEEVEAALAPRLGQLDPSAGPGDSLAAVLT